MPWQSRRRFLEQGAYVAGLAATGLPGILMAGQAPSVLMPAATRPDMRWGLQFGDVTPDRAIIWSRTDKAARMFVEWSRGANFSDSRIVRGPFALEHSDFTARLDLDGLPPDADIFVRVFFAGLDTAGTKSESVHGRFRTAPSVRAGSDRPDTRGRDVRFLWSGDTAGQGYGINPDLGGMRIYDAMLKASPDFFIHSGDTIYADSPMDDQITDPQGNVWKNAFLAEVPEKRKVAETQLEFHRAHLYNRFDENIRRFTAEVPQIWQWDDHEVINNWSDSKDISGDSRYTEKNVPTLVGRATKAFLDYAPLRWYDQRESERVYRKFSYGPELDLFVVDMRSYRGANSANLQPQPGADTAFLGAVQLDWLKKSLQTSTATWKVIAADMPIGLNVGDGEVAPGTPRWEAIANGNNGAPLGREFEVATLLKFMRRNRIYNVVWLTADVHYCAAHYYDPNKAQFQDFDPFWEFVSGPLNAGSFGPNSLDDTFGPQVRFFKAPPAGQANLSPIAGLQFFGQVDIDAASKQMTVRLKDIDGLEVFSQVLQAKPGPG